MRRYLTLGALLLALAACSSDGVAPGGTRQHPLGDALPPPNLLRP